MMNQRSIIISSGSDNNFNDFGQRFLAFSAKEEWLAKTKFVSNDNKSYGQLYETTVVVSSIMQLPTLLYSSGRSIVSSSMSCGNKSRSHNSTTDAQDSLDFVWSIFAKWDSWGRKWGIQGVVYGAFYFCRYSSCAARSLSLRESMSTYI